MKQGQVRIATAPKATRNDKQIKVVEYVHTAEGVKPVEALGPEEREKFRRWLLCTWLNGLYVGKAVLYYPEETEVASDARRYGQEEGGAGDG